MLAGICATVLGLVQSQPAYADLRLIVTDSAGGATYDNTFVCNPNCTVNNWGAAGQIFLTNYTIDFTTTQEIQNSGAAILNFTGTVSSHNAGGLLTIQLIGNNFSLPTSVTGSMLMASSASVTGQNLIGSTDVYMTGRANQNNTTDPLDAGWVSSPTGSTSVCCTNSSNINNGQIPWTRLASDFALQSILQIQMPNNVNSLSVGSSVTATAVPEPASLILLGSGLLAAGRRLRRKVQA
jgi:hypothetical protein